MHNFVTISNKKGKTSILTVFILKKLPLGSFLLLVIFLIFEKLFADFYYLSLPNL